MKIAESLEVSTDYLLVEQAPLRRESFDHPSPSREGRGARFDCPPSEINFVARILERVVIVIGGPSFGGINWVCR